jgi:hypothetical protein
VSAAAEVVCNRCGGSNRPGAARCWVCYTPLVSGAVSADVEGALRKDVSNPMVTALKIVLVLCCIVAMIPVLLFVTCVGILMVAN